MDETLKNDFKCIINDSNIDFKCLAGHTLLVSGASGLIPSYIVKSVLYLNSLKIYEPIKVIGIVRNINRAHSQYKDFKNDDNLVLIEQDITKPLIIKDNVDYIIHAASQVSPKLFYSDPVGTINANTIGTYNMLCLAKEKNVKSFLYFSSGEVCGDIFNNKDLVTEEDYGIVNPLDVRNCYAESKRMGENMCYCWHHQYGIPTKIVRPSHTYGPGFKADDGRCFASFVMNILNNEDIVLKSDGSAKRSFLYLTDAVRAYFLVLLNGINGEAYNIGNNKELSIKELADLLISLADNKNLKVIFEIADKNPSSKSTHGQLDITKIQKLGWTPIIPEKEGFRRTLSALKNKEIVL